MQPKIGLSEEQRAGAVELLSATLADEFALYTKTRNYHWNVTGPRFNDLHKFFEQHYQELEEKIDETAEFIRKLGTKVPASMSVFAKNTRLKEDNGEGPNADGMVKNLLHDHESLIRCLRDAVEKAEEEYEAADVTDYLTTLMEDHLKMAWMLRALAEPA